MAALIKGRLSDNQTSDRKPVGLPFRLKNSEHLHAFLFPNIQHSTFHHQPKAGGFETTDCLECLQILNILQMAGGSTLKLEIGHCALYQDMVFQGGKRIACFPLVKLLYSYVFPPLAHQHAFPCSHIVESTIHHLRSRWSTLSFKKGASFRKLNFFLALAFLRFFRTQNISMLSLALTYWNQLSTIRRGGWI